MVGESDTRDFENLLALRGVVVESSNTAVG